MRQPRLIDAERQSKRLPTSWPAQWDGDPLPGERPLASDRARPRRAAAAGPGAVLEIPRPHPIEPALPSRLAAEATSQCDIYAKEGIDLDVSTLADWVGACAATLAPLVEAIETHVLSAERIHADDTLPSRLAAEATSQTCRCWRKTNVRPAGCGPMCAMIGRSVARRRRLRCSTTHRTATANTPNAI